MKKLLTTLLLVVNVLACQAQEPVNDASETTTTQTADEKEVQAIRDLARKNNGGKEPTDAVLWKALVQKANEKAGLIKNYRKPRIVPKGAKPEILVFKDHIVINGHKVKIEDSLENWVNAIDSPKNCIYGHNNTICYWDNLGITILAPKKNNEVIQLTIDLNIDKREYWAKSLVTHRPDGTPVKPDVKSKPDNPFTGYLAIDGYGIDAKTQFWEIRDSVAPERGNLGLKCKISCSHIYGDGLFLRVKNGKETGVMYWISISK